MTTTSAAASASTAATQPKPAVGKIDTEKARAKIGADLDSFLLMLTTQLQNQDPLSPMESNEFTQQLTSFAQVEQQIGINENLQSLMSMQQGSMNTLALGYLGKYAEIEDNVIQLDKGTAKFAYSIKDKAKSVTLEISNSKGAVVKTVTGNVAPGSHVYTWNGTDDAQAKLPDGQYKVKVTALDGDDKPIESWTTVQAQITAVSTDGQEPYLTINGVAVPMRDIKAVSATAG